MAGKNVVEAIGPTYHLADVKAAVQSSINCFPKRIAGSKFMMESAEGTVDIATLGVECRASRYIYGSWFVVAGANVYIMQTNGTTALIGTISNSSGKVSISHNTTQVVIVNGPNMYVTNFTGSSFTSIVVPAWRGSNNVDEMDGYFILSEPNTDQFYITAIDDGTVLDALDFSSADASPDIIVAHVVFHHQLWIFGEKSTEIWVNSGATDFPFTRYTSYPIDIGCVSPHGFCIAADTLFFVGKTERGTAVVYMVQGNQPTPISNTAIEELLLGSTDLSKVEMFAYQPKGHEHVCITAPGMKTMLVYDAREKLWHERADWINGDWNQLKWRFVTLVGDTHYGGDTDGNVFRLDPDVNQYSGRHLVRERTWPHLMAPTMEPVSYKGLELSLKTGYGGSVTLELSNDSGQTFGPMLMRNLGATGRWMQRIRWLGLGSAINRIFRIRCSDNVPFALYQADVDV